jgi:hypothetical protein
MNPHFLFPASPLNGRMIDEAFQDQAIALKQAGFNTSVMDVDGGRIRPAVEPGAVCVYRGWMMNIREYLDYETAVVANQATPITATNQYVTAHWLPNWYPILSRWTPQTEVFPLESASIANLTDACKQLGWAKFQIKDYVKSLKTAGGSVAIEPGQVPEIVANMEKYRGTIEGGICVRQWEEFFPHSETRYFVINGRYFGQDIAFDTRAMRILDAIKERIPSPFWSVDIAQRRDGEFRIVEIGDGQVSDLVGWSPQRFAEVWK